MSWIKIIKITCESVANRLKNIWDSGNSIKHFYGKLNRSGVMKTPEDVKREFEKGIKEVQGVPSDSYLGAGETQKYKRGFEEARRQAEQTARQAAIKRRARKPDGWKPGKVTDDNPKQGL